MIQHDAKITLYLRYNIQYEQLIHKTKSGYRNYHYVYWQWHDAIQLEQKKSYNNNNGIR